MLFCVRASRIFVPMHWNYHLKELDQVAAGILQNLQHPIVCFEGDLGAGKTTLIKSLCAQLGCTDTANSPTFSLINPYRDGQGNPVYHFDCYRLNTLEEALDFGVEEYLDGGNRCFVEWPNLILPLIGHYDHIQIKVLPDGQRQLTLEHL